MALRNRPVTDHTAAMRTDKNDCDVLIVGGGAIGLSLAYHLGHIGGLSVRVLERNRLTSGTSWHAAGIVGPLRASLNLTHMAMYATDLFPRLEVETGQATGFRTTGGYWLAQTEQRMIELRRIAGMGRRVGLGVSFVTPGDIANAVPGLSPDGLVGALRVEEDAQVNPVDLCMAYAKGARAKGVVIDEGIGVASIETREGRATGALLDDGTRMSAKAVALCTGAWTKPLAESAGAIAPLQAVEHMYIVTEPMAGLPDPMPILRDLDAGIYLKGDAGKLVLGGFEPNAKVWQPEKSDPKADYLMFQDDWDQFAPFMEAGLRRMPTFETAGVQTFMNGPESFTPDTKQLMGETPDVQGLYVAAGFNSIGIMSSAGAGKALAEWIAAGEAPFDLWDVDIARADPKWSSEAFLADRMREAVANQFAMHWPLKQPHTGRNLRPCPLHDVWQKVGGVFGVTAGWERALWYAETNLETRLPDTYGPQPWWPIAEREAKHMAKHVAVLELSPFTKIDVTGPGACAALETLCAGDIDIPVGRTLYTVMLNTRGGIEADITVSRFVDDHFRITCPAATRWKDLAWIRRHIPNGTTVQVGDMTENEAVVGVMGARARDLMMALSDGDWSNAAFPFGAVRTVMVSGKVVRATRISFVGELGYELSILVDDVMVVYDALQRAGAAFYLKPLGHLALDGCRFEKGFRHWGHDLGPDITPLEGGIGFTISKTRHNFIGADAIVKQRDQGVDKRLVLLTVEDGPNGLPVLLHDEPVYLDDQIVGLTTSGGRGPRTGLSLCFAMVACGAQETLDQVRRKPYQVDVAGVRYAATALARPPYDADGLRMKS